ncbi:hypothetical protein C8J56DRAFT_725995, partial [Mycena floridula]
WVLSLSRITIIFVQDHSPALRISLYPMRCNPELAWRVRKCDASNEEDYNKMTRAMVNALEPSGPGLILVSTDVLMVGVDMKNVQCSLIVEPLTFDEDIQKEGRVFREQTEGQIAEVYIYVSANTLHLAQEMVEAEESQPKK